MFFIDIMGGLGNQLFQIFTALSYEMQTGINVVFPYSIQLGEFNTGVTVRYTYWDTIFKNIKNKTTFNSQNFEKENQEKRKWVCYRETGFHFSPIPTHVFNFNFQIFGYFQSWKYFHNESQKIIRNLKLYSIKEEVLEKYCHYRFPEETRISMHFRLGDYKNKQDYHPVLPLEYYYSALGKCINELSSQQHNKITVLFFCEDEDIQFILKERIEPLKSLFSNVKFCRIETTEDWEQLMVMTNCHHHIIANSSFSWWGAYLAPLLFPSNNGGEFQLVYYPSKWFGPAMSNVSTDDLFLPQWNRISISG